MAACYLAVCNIPQTYRSCDLRNFFSEHVETGRFDCFHFRHRPQSEILSLRHLKESCEGSGSTGEDQCEMKTFCDNPLICIVKCTDKATSMRTYKKYHLQNWSDKSGNLLTQRCIISRVSLQPDPDQEASLLIIHVTTKVSDIHMSKERIDSMIEMKPPAVMPQGNVGTPTKHFLKLITTCQLPSQLIGKLGLSFPKSRTRKYGNVAYDYSKEERNCRRPIRMNTRVEPTTQPTKRQTTNTNQTPKTDEKDEEEEEWDRHEALHNDVTEQGREKERLYEEEEEVVWEKGGPGLVWYTDAQLWREAEGDFDEQTTDDWDVDYSIYYEEGAGDKDARDALEMRQSEMWRLGQVESVFKKPDDSTTKRYNQNRKRKSDGDSVGPFEQHTKGFGRKLMEKQGWTDGLCLGSSQKGISKPIESEGQAPRTRKGLGYYGEQLQRFPTGRPKARKDVQITTVYDRPSDTDPHEPLLTSNPPTVLKYRLH